VKLLQITIINYTNYLNIVIFTIQYLNIVISTIQNTIKPNNQTNGGSKMENHDEIMDFLHNLQSNTASIVNKSVARMSDDELEKTVPDIQRRLD
jgi:hypothetical protein